MKNQQQLDTPSTASRPSGSKKCTSHYTSEGSNFSKLDHDYSGSEQINKIRPMEDDDEIFMDWQRNGRSDENLRLELYRLGVNSSTSSSTKCNPITTSNSNDSSTNSKDINLVDEIDETELNKLRVRENSSNGEDDAELSYNEDSSGLDLMEGTSQEENASVPIVPGSDTPYEEPSEPSCGLLLGNLEIARVRAQYLAIAARPLADRKPLFGRENDPCMPQPNEAEIEAQLQLLRPSNNSKKGRRRKGSSHGSSLDENITMQSCSGLNESRRFDDVGINYSKDNCNSSVDDGRESWDDSDEDDEDLDKSSFDNDCNEDSMHVQENVNSKDKKQVCWLIY